MGDDMNELDRLPHYKDALKLPKDEYYKYANGIFEYRSNCQTFMVEINEKFYEWCSALNCLQSGDNCKIPPYPEPAITSDSLMVTMTTTSHQTTQLITTSYNQLMNAVGYNGTCYDDFYCNQRSVAIYLHFILGIACLVMCLVGILSTSLFLPAFNVASNRTGVTFYLTAMAVFDCIYMVLFTIIVIIQYIPSEFTDQLDMYARFTAYFIPHGLPTMQLMELLSVWITVAILVDRFLYLKFGFHSKIICSRRVSAKILAAIIILLIIYTIPKYLEYHLIEYPHSGVLKVMFTAVGFNESFQNMLLHWLKVPIEMFLPYLADAIFSVINSIKFYDLMYKRKLSEASKDKRNHARMNGMGGDAHLSLDVDPMLHHGDIEKDTLKFPSLAINSSIPIITTSLKGAEDKENAMVIVSLIMGFLLLALKLPKFVLHALKSEEYVDIKSTKFFQPINDFLDLSWVLLKPIVYFLVAKHFRAALKSVFCCDEFQADAAVIKVCPAATASLQMNEIASEYLRNVASEFNSNSLPNSVDGGCVNEEEKQKSKLIQSDNEDGGLVMKVDMKDRDEERLH